MEYVTFSQNLSEALVEWKYALVLMPSNNP